MFMCGSGSGTTCSSSTSSGTSSTIGSLVVVEVFMEDGAATLRQMGSGSANDTIRVLEQNNRYRSVSQSGARSTVIHSTHRTRSSRLRRHVVELMIQERP